MRSQLEIRSFTDAIAVAFGVRRRFSHAHTAALVDAFGQVVDLTVFSLRSSSVDTALGWAACFVSNETCSVRRMVLVSAVAAGEGRPDADVEVLRRARERFADLGVLVVDWLQCDGNVVHSTDLASDGEGWCLARAAAA
ncbi:MAG: hypothetical protein JO086_03100 [Acidimicrobiia bacterium]|nr:hypothetical protein [Acidimicrobiia bacterium]